ncbi:hypothetical protein TYRP_008938 [Tyrophagus putrescentiae]|nr:hypothetical protein TYRP_008938 [Tyrophagus putrescentiae]
MDINNNNNAAATTPASHDIDLVSAFVRLRVDEVQRAGAGAAGRRLVRGLAAARPAAAEEEEGEWQEEEEEEGHNGAPEDEDYGPNANRVEEGEDHWGEEEGMGPGPGAPLDGPQDVGDVGDAGSQEAGGEDDDGGNGRRAPPARRRRRRGGPRPALPRRAGLWPRPVRQPEGAPQAPAPPAPPAPPAAAANQRPASEYANDKYWPALLPEYYPLQRCTVAELRQITDEVLLNAMRGQLREEDVTLLLTDEQRANFAREFLVKLEGRAPEKTEEGRPKIPCRVDSWCTVTTVCGRKKKDLPLHFAQENTGPHRQGTLLPYACPLCPFRAPTVQSVGRHLNDKMAMMPEKIPCARYAEVLEAASLTFHHYHHHYYYYYHLL